jgi:hypothetical protein
MLRLAAGGRGVPVGLRLGLGDGEGLRLGMLGLCRGRLLLGLGGVGVESEEQGAVGGLGVLLELMEAGG